MAIGADEDLCYRSIAELTASYARRGLSPREVVEAFLRRIEALDGVLHSYITVTAETAKIAARESEGRYTRGEALGPLDGVPIGVKDLFDTVGIRTTANSLQYADRIPLEESTVVRKLLDAGSVLLGKLTMYEFASGTPALDALSPPAHNPWNVDLVPGGSSSGSAAAVSAGLCTVAMGSDTGGSIRGPASYCGIVGLKPTNGLVSRFGVVPLSWTLDVVGPMGRTVMDVAAVLQVVAGYDGQDPGSVHAAIPNYVDGLTGVLEGVRIGAPLAAVEGAPDLDPAVMAAYREALGVFDRLGANVAIAELLEYEHVNTVGQTLLVAEAFAFHERNARRRPEMYGSNFYSRLQQGAILSASDYIQAQRGRALITRAMTDLMREFDLLVLPTSPHPAWSFKEERETPSWKRTSFTRLFNITGQPAISLPCGCSPQGLPIGLQIAGRRGQDALVLAVAYAYERASRWCEARPPLGYG